MSHYAFFEFAMVHRPLTDAEMETMEALSSRADVTPYRASYTYHYSDFPGDPAKLLHDHFDALFHIANWGSVWLMFKLPLDAVDLDQLREYSMDDRLSVYAIKEHAIVNICLEEMDVGWVEDEGHLDKLLPLREALLNGDLRLLFVAWLGLLGAWERDEPDNEPIAVPIPPGLRQVDSSLVHFMRLFDIWEFLIDAAAEESPPLPDFSPDAWSHWARQLHPHEQIDYLVQVASGKQNVGPALRHRLEQLAQAEDDHRWLPVKTQRSMDSLKARAKHLAELHTANEIRKKAEQRRIYLAHLATTWNEQWALIDDTLQTTSGSAYDTASKLIEELVQAAQQEDLQEDLQQRFHQFFKNHSHRPKLMERLRKKGITPQCP